MWFSLATHLDFFFDLVGGSYVVMRSHGDEVIVLTFKPIDLILYCDVTADALLQLLI